MAALKKKRAGGNKRSPFLKELSPQHELFCLELVKRGLRHKLEAYNAAGFKGASVQSASRLSFDPLIKARIGQLMGERFKALQMDVDEILARTAMIARADARALFDEHGNLRPMSELDEEEAAAVAGIETLEEFDGTGKDRKKVGDVRKVRLRDPMPALRLLAEHKKLVKAPDDGVNALATALADRLKAARERARKRPTPQEPT